MQQRSAQYTFNPFQTHMHLLSAHAAAEQIILLMDPNLHIYRSSRTTLYKITTQPRLVKIGEEKNSLWRAFFLQGLK